MPPSEVSTYSFGNDAYRVVDTNGNHQIDPGEVTSADGHVLDAGELKLALRQNHISRSIYSLSNQGLTFLKTGGERKTESRIGLSALVEPIVSETKAAELDGMIRGLLTLLANEPVMEMQLPSGGSVWVYPARD